MKIVHLLAGAAATVAAAAPLAAQPYPYPYPQQYPQQYPQTYPYPQTGYPYPGYQQPYGGNVVGQVINQLLGNRYNVTDRTAVTQCASAAVIQAQNQYRGYGQGYGGYNQGYGGYGQGIVPSMMRVTAITDVQRRDRGLRVTGLINSGMYGGYNQGYGGYGNQAYATGDLRFRCNVAYNGQVTNLRVTRNTDYRR